MRRWACRGLPAIIMTKILQLVGLVAGGSSSGAHRRHAEDGDHLRPAVPLWARRGSEPRACGSVGPRRDMIAYRGAQRKGAGGR